MQALIKRLAGFWNAVPLKLVVVSVGVLWVAKEFYPFSHFPMYSNFTEADYVVFIADGDGQPLPVEYISAGVRTARLKKHFNGEVNRIREEIGRVEGARPRQRDMTPEQLQPAGGSSLDWVMPAITATGRLAPDVRELQIHQILIEYKKGEIVKTGPRLIASRPVPMP